MLLLFFFVKINQFDRFKAKNKKQIYPDLVESFFVFLKIFNYRISKKLIFPKKKKFLDQFILRSNAFCAWNISLTLIMMVVVHIWKLFEWSTIHSIGRKRVCRIHILIDNLLPTTTSNYSTAIMIYHTRIWQVGISNLEKRKKNRKNRLILIVIFEKKNHHHHS